MTNKEKVNFQPSAAAVDPLCSQPLNGKKYEYLFPDLDRLLKNEEQRIANEKAKNADQLLNTGMSAMTNEFVPAAVPVNNFL